MAVQSSNDEPQRGCDSSDARPPTWKFTAGHATSRGTWKLKPILLIGDEELTDRFVRPYLLAIAKLQPSLCDQVEQRALQAQMSRLSLIEPYFFAHPTAMNLAEIDQFLHERPVPAAAIEPDLGDMNAKGESTLRGLITSLRHHRLVEYAYWLDQARKFSDAGAVGYALETLVAHHSAQEVIYAGIAIGLKALDLLPRTFTEAFLNAFVNLESYMAKRLLLPPVSAIVTSRCDAAYRADPLEDFHKLSYDVEENLSMAACADDALLSRKPASLQVDIEVALEYQLTFINLAETIRPRFVARAAALSLFCSDEPSTDRLPIEFDALAKSLVSIAECSADSPSLRNRCIELAQQCARQVPKDDHGFAAMALVFQKADIGLGVGLPMPSGMQAVRLSDKGDIAIQPVRTSQALERRRQSLHAAQTSSTPVAQTARSTPVALQPTFTFSTPFSFPAFSSSTGRADASPGKKMPQTKATRGASSEASKKTPDNLGQEQSSLEKSIAHALKRSLSNLLGLDELIQNFAFDVHDFLLGEQSVGRLFWGGPGVGKTDFAQRLAGQRAGYPGLILPEGDVAYLSGVDGAVQMRDYVDKLPPKSILFIDEADKRFDPKAEMVSAAEATQVRHALTTHFQRKPIMYILIGTFAHLPRLLDDALVGEAFGPELASRLDYVDWHFPSWTVAKLLQAIRSGRRLKYDDDAALCLAEYCIKKSGGIRMFENLENTILRRRRSHSEDLATPVSLAVADELVLRRGGS